MTNINSTKPSLGHSTVSALVNYLTQAGINESIIKDETGIPICMNKNQDARIPLHQYRALWNLALKTSQDPALGLKLGASKDLSQMGIVGHIAYNSEDLETALKHYIRLFNIVNESVSVSFTRNSSSCSLNFFHKLPESYCIPDIERSLVLTLYRTRAWLDKDLPLESAHFCHKAPIYETDYKKVFGCPVYFNQTECKLIFSSQYLAMDSKKSNPYIKQACLNQANELISKLNFQSLSEKVKNYIHHELASCEPTIERISSLLNISKQTLSRKLKQEGTLFQKLLESVRFDKARQLLEQSALSTSEIALALGFSELSAFSRAFKRWSGVSPKNFRESIAIE